MQTNETILQVAPTRPIPLSEDAVIFELQDGRVQNSKLFAKTDYSN